MKLRNNHVLSIVFGVFGLFSGMAAMADTVCTVRGNICNALYSPEHTFCSGIKPFFTSCNTTGGDHLGTQANYKCPNPDNSGTKITVSVSHLNPKVHQCTKIIIFKTGSTLRNITTQDVNWNPDTKTGLDYIFY